MTKDDVIAVLSSIELVYHSEDYHIDRSTFEPLITAKPELGIKCLYSWMSHYFITFKSKQLIEVYAMNPNWNTFQTAAFFLMIDRVIAAVALEGQVTSQVAECIKYTLKPGYNIDAEAFTWVEFYTSTKSEKHSVA